MGPDKIMGGFLVEKRVGRACAAKVGGGIPVSVHVDAEDGTERQIIGCVFYRCHRRRSNAVT